MAQLAQQATSKVPPYWEPALELKCYPYKVWLQDISIWAAGTELQEVLQAPAVAQRLGGTAKDLIRELPAKQLREGRLDLMTGEQTQTGLELLLGGLTKRYGQYEIETTATSIVELLFFVRSGHESLDEALSRFETLRNRAENCGAGFSLPVTVVGYLILEKMHVPRPMWPLVSSPLNQKFPDTEEGLRTLFESLRRQGHLAESPHAGANSWNPGGRHHHDYHFQDGGAPGLADQSWAFAVEPQHSHTPAGGAPQQQDTYATDAEGYPCCASCGAYHYEEGGDGDDSDTEDEYGQEMSREELEEYTGGLEGCTSAQLHSEYLFAKRRYRAFTRKSPRRDRFPRKAPWAMSKGRGPKGKGRGVFHGKGFMPHVSAHSLAGGGVGQTNGKNPVDASGKTVRCHECDSETHLVAACPQRHAQKGKGKGKGGGKAYLQELLDTDWSADSHQPSGLAAAHQAYRQPVRQTWAVNVETFDLAADDDDEPVTAAAYAATHTLRATRKSTPRAPRCIPALLNDGRHS